MKTSTELTKIAKQISLFHSKIGAIKKDAKNPFFKSTYASLHNILDMIQPLLNECGLIIIQCPEKDNTLSTSVVDVNSGEFIESSYTMPVKDISNPQAIGSAITYARRYAIVSILCLNIMDEDDDANKATQQPAKEIAKGPQPSELPGLTQYETDGKTHTRVYASVISALNDGRATIADVEKKFSLTPQQKQFLCNLIK